MLRNATAAFAILLVLGSFELSTSAVARGSDYDGSGGGDAFLDNHFRIGLRNISRDGHRNYGDRTRGLSGGFRRYEGRDMWGHLGAYYGPMIPSI
jgi:hypothetical protein